jgi:uncharacterized glyoxalase superfamily protein PhnB
MAKNAKKKATKPATKTAKAMPKRVASKPAAKAAKPKTAKAPASSGGFAFTRIAPGFTVNDAVASVAWYRDVLGFTVKERWEIEGKFMGAEMNSGSVTVNLGQDDWKLGRDRNKGQGTRMYITTGPDIDGLAEQLKARGASLDSDPKDEWGVRAFSLTDPDGYKLTFMTPLKK